MPPAQRPLEMERSGCMKNREWASKDKGKKASEDVFSTAPT